MHPEKLAQKQNNSAIKFLHDVSGSVFVGRPVENEASIGQAKPHVEGQLKPYGLVS